MLQRRVLRRRGRVRGRAGRYGGELSAGARVHSGFRLQHGRRRALRDQARRLLPAGADDLVRDRDRRRTDDDSRLLPVGTVAVTISDDQPICCDEPDRCGTSRGSFAPPDESAGDRGLGGKGGGFGHRLLGRHHPSQAEISSNVFIAEFGSGNGDSTLVIDE